MSRRFGPVFSVLALLLALNACNSDRPEPAEFTLVPEGLRIRITRVATHPFLSRHNLTLHVEQPGGCAATADLFPDTGYADRRNVYRQASGLVGIVGQYDVRVIEPSTCAISLIEFRSWDRQAQFLGSFEVDAKKRWQFFPATERQERPFEKL